MTHPSSYELYSATCDAAARTVISAYSTSFGAAVKLLGSRHRGHIRNIYALVRIADELVDGVGSEAGLSAPAQRELLDALEEHTLHAISHQFSTNPVVHAFALTAARCDIGRDLIAPFFESMRTDIAEDDAPTPAAAAPQLQTFDSQAHARYVYGSAEVIGLMCLHVFIRGHNYSAAEYSQLQAGARALGAAFQNINFLRDVADDAHRLRRNYLGTRPQVTPAEHAAWLAIITSQLETARRSLPLLPKDARRAVRCATSFFTALARKIAATPPAQLYERRIRISNPHKVFLFARATTRTALERSTTSAAS